MTEALFAAWITGIITLLVMPAVITSYQEYKAVSKVKNGTWKYELSAASG
ncbi:MAG: hypothetical protein LUE64_05295 [Candidatus Gastranaerophilales bacterium]|nr:hypothetical protein [Candidatus Gastranaerophilales bacterium]